MTKSKPTNNSILCVCLLLMLGLFLTFQNVIATAVKESLRLCYCTIIPSLFPFIILTDMLRSHFIVPPNFLPAKLFSRLFSTSENGFFPFLMGAICGFPVGTKEVTVLYKNHKLNKSEAQHLLGFVNLASPAFTIFGVGVGLKNSLKEGILLYLIQIVSAVFVARLMNPKEKTKEPSISIASTSPSFPHIVMNASISMLSVCGMICIFSTITALFQHIFPTYISIFPTIFLELVNGSKAIFLMFSNRPLVSFALTAFAISFGGFSVHMQANLFISETDLSFWKYVLGKMIGALFAFTLALLYGLLFSL